MPYKDKAKRAAAVLKSRSKKPELYKQLDHNKERARSQRGYHIERRYGLSKTDHDALLRKQGGTCAICCQPPSMKSQKSSVLHVDHDHKNGKVRGLLCGPCNRHLGWFEKHTPYVRYYLENPTANRN